MQNGQPFCVTEWTSGPSRPSNGCCSSEVKSSSAGCGMAALAIPKSDSIDCSQESEASFALAVESAICLTGIPRRRHRCQTLGTILLNAYQAAMTPAIGLAKVDDGLAVRRLIVEEASPTANPEAPGNTKEQKSIDRPASNRWLKFRRQPARRRRLGHLRPVDPNPNSTLDDCYSQFHETGQCPN